MKELQELIDNISEWSGSTFGRGDRAIAITHHLKKEVEELIEALNVANAYKVDDSIGVGEFKRAVGKAKVEYADCFMLLLDSACHFGLNAKSLIEVTSYKLGINKSRTWGKPDKNGVVEHIKFAKDQCDDCNGGFQASNKSKESGGFYPELPEEGKKEVQILVYKFKEQLTKVANEVLANLYADVSIYIETDSWANFRNQLMDGFKNYQNSKIHNTYDFKVIRREIYNEFKSELIEDLNSDLVEENASLKAEVENLNKIIRGLRLQ